jgi:hypothetical protein
MEKQMNSFEHPAEMETSTYPTEENIRIKEHLTKNDLSNGHKFALNELNAQFEKYDVLYSIGQKMYEFYNNDFEPSAYKEYCSTMFAVKYLQEKQEVEYLADLLDNIKGVLTLHKTIFDFDIEKISELYLRYQKNDLARIVLRFNCFMRCIEENCDLLCVVQVISNGNIDRINHDILFRKGICGAMLGNECVQSVFSFCEDIPENINQYLESLEDRINKV